MNESGATGFEQWAATAIARRWPGATLADFVALRGDLSTRRFWRAMISSTAEDAPATAIVVDLGPDDLPRYVRVLDLLADALAEPPWINVHRFLSSLGAGVPALYDSAP